MAIYPPPGFPTSLDNDNDRSRGHRAWARAGRRVRAKSRPTLRTRLPLQAPHMIHVTDEGLSSPAGLARKPVLLSGPR